MLTFVACEDDDAGNSSQESFLELMVCGQERDVVYTRAMTDMPTGYSSYEELYPNPKPELRTIGICLYSSSGNKTGVFRYDVTDKKWKSNVPITAGLTYDVYGVMPSEVANNVEYNKSGEIMTMTLKGLSAVTSADLSVVVGVNDVAPSEFKSGEKIDYYGCDLGKFSYVGKAEENYVCILLDHLYSCINFEYAMGRDDVATTHLLYDKYGYSNLRTIKIKKVDIVAESGGTYQATVNLHHNTEKKNPMLKADGTYDITWSSSGTNKSEANVFNGGSDHPALVPEGATNPATGSPYVSDDANHINYVTDTSDGNQQYLSIPGYFVPSETTSSSVFKIVTTYDIYDKKGNLVRSDCKATNKWSPPVGLTIERGKCYTIRVTIKPTYLYQLSDPDLDNPSFVLN